MSLTGAEVAHLLAVLGLLLLASHAVGHLFTLLKQPRVIGEIGGGLLLGPTILGAVAPHTQAAIFPTEGAVAGVLGWWYQLGLLLLMFCSGAQMRSLFHRDDARVVGLVTVTGVVVPFAAGVVVFQVIDSSGLMGPANSDVALLLVFGLAVAVTSIPVISRIMLDLGILHTSFARIVLGVAVIEDVVVYVVLALALGLVSGSGGEAFGLPALLGISPGSGQGMVFHTAATLAFFALMLTSGRRAFLWSRRRRWNLVASNPIAYHLLFVFGATLICLVLGITPIFGAFLAGITVRMDDESDHSTAAAREAINSFAFAFFVPVYFAAVGLQLDLVHHFHAAFFAGFLVFACVVKSASVYVGARLAHEGVRGSVNLAVATNARGGPGIVLASVTYAAGIISEAFYAALVMLAVLTSMLAGAWLVYVVTHGKPLRDAPDTRPEPPRP